MEPFIKIRNLKKIYRMGDEKVYALNGIDLDIYKNEVRPLYVMSMLFTKPATFINNAFSAGLNALLEAKDPDVFRFIVKSHAQLKGYDKIRQIIIDTYGNQRPNNVAAWFKDEENIK